MRLRSQRSLTAIRYNPPVDFQQTLDYLYGLQRFGIKLGLENIRTLLERLGNPQEAFSCLHVAGTNGKGSVSAFLAETLRHAGVCTGLYTSPHLHCFTERIRINGQPVSQEFACQLAVDVQAASVSLPITFFEATTAMALLAFQRSDVEMAILETGLGGRLDATNVVQPLLSLITPVSLDHQEHLGDDLATIAAEKAGIIKPGVPVVVGRQEPEVNKVLLKVAAECSAPVYLVDRDYQRMKESEGHIVRLGERQVSALTNRLPGAHQLDNMAQAVAAGLLLADSGWPVTPESCRQAGRSVVWPGRLEWWPGPPAILMDAAHNAAGVASLVSHLRQCDISGMPVLVGLSRGRQPARVLKSLAGIAGDVYAVPVGIGDSVDPAEIVEWAQSEGLDACSYSTPEEGFEAALDACSESVPLVVCGSLFLVAAIRKQLGEFQPFDGLAG